MTTPTVDRQSASGRVWDAAVVGAGPAGTLAAYHLARAGAAVLLIDRAVFPRWKVCGSCLNGRALAELSAAGLGPLAATHGAVPLRQFNLWARGRQARLPLSEGVALSRPVFDMALVDAAVAAGARFMPHTQATLGPLVPRMRQLNLRQPDGCVDVRAKVVLAADGLGGAVANGEGGTQPPVQSSRIGAGVLVESGAAGYASGTIYMACGRSGYVGLVRVEDGRLDIAAALDPGALAQAGGPATVAAGILREAGLPKVPGLADGCWRGTPPLTRRVGIVAAERLFILGDAAGYVEPFTGEGMAWALASARALAPLALRAVERWEPALVADWTALHRRLVARRQLLCRLAAWLLRRPPLTRALIEALARFPALARPFLRRLNDPSLTDRSIS